MVSFSQLSQVRFTKVTIVEPSIPRSASGQLSNAGRTVFPLSSFVFINLWRYKMLLASNGDVRSYLISTHGITLYIVAVWPRPPSKSCNLNYPCEGSIAEEQWDNEPNLGQWENFGGSQDLPHSIGNGMRAYRNRTTQHPKLLYLIQSVYYNSDDVSH